jgi:hypothetical protein
MFPPSASGRKAIPVFSGFVRYFPRAMAAVAELSRIGNDQHNPGEPLHWAREKSGDELDACMRHLMEAGSIDTDGVRHSTKAAWRAMANLEKELELVERDAQRHGVSQPTPGGIQYVGTGQQIFRER